MLFHLLLVVCTFLHSSHGGFIPKPKITINPFKHIISAIQDMQAENLEAAGAIFGILGQNHQARLERWSEALGLTKAEATALYNEVKADVQAVYQKVKQEVINTVGEVLGMLSKFGTRLRDVKAKLDALLRSVLAQVKALVARILEKLYDQGYGGGQIVDCLADQIRPLNVCGVKPSTILNSESVYQTICASPCPACFGKEGIHGSIACAILEVLMPVLIILAHVAFYAALMIGDTPPNAPFELTITGSGVWALFAVLVCVACVVAYWRCRKPVQRKKYAPVFQAETDDESVAIIA